MRLWSADAVTTRLHKGLFQHRFKKFRLEHFCIAARPRAGTPAQIAGARSIATPACAQ
jgi:hypothetical protein